MAVPFRPVEEHFEHLDMAVDRLGRDLLVPRFLNDLHQRHGLQLGLRVSASR